MNGIEGQGHRSKFKVEYDKSCLYQPSLRKAGHRCRSSRSKSLSEKEVRVKGQHGEGQISRSRSLVMIKSLLEKVSGQG